MTTATLTNIALVLQTGAASAPASPFGILTTLDCPKGNYNYAESIPAVTAHAFGRQGFYVLSSDDYNGVAYADVLPTPGGTTDTPYDSAPKQTYVWKSKKFVMPGRTTWAAAKVVHIKGCVRLRLYVDGCCKYETVVTGCGPFRLGDQLVGKTLEIELIGTAQVREVHVASTMEELANE